MAVQQLGKLEVVDVRKVWEHEAFDFTPWLFENLNLLGETLGLELIGVQCEAQVGKFSLDILARDENGAMVAIENQLGGTDHGHLGQLLTYAAGHDVRTLIWITPHFEDEHRAALDWLNLWTQEGIEIYGVEVRAVCIGDSLPAPEFVPVVLPNTWSKKEKAKSNPEGANRKEFYQLLVDRLRDEGFTDKMKATSAWIQRFPSGVSDLTYNADVGNNPRVFMSMSDKDKKKQVFDTLRNDTKQMKQIEDALGLKFDPETEIIWKTAPGNISVSRKGSGNDLTDEVRDWMFDYLIKFKDVFNPRMEEIIDNLSPDDE